MKHWTDFLSFMMVFKQLRVYLVIQHKTDLKDIKHITLRVWYHVFLLIVQDIYNLSSLKKLTSLKISKFIILKNWLGWSEFALPFSNSTIKLFILMESDHVDQIKLIESRQSHKVDKIKIFQIKLNISNSSNSVEKIQVFI